MDELGFEIQALVSNPGSYSVQYGNFLRHYDFSVKNLLPCIMQDFAKHQFFYGQMKVVKQYGK